MYPASYDVPDILSVAALDRSGGLAAFSNFRAEAVDLAAPGVDIVGAGFSRDPSDNPPSASFELLGAADRSEPFRGHTSGVLQLVGSRQPTHPAAG